MTSYNRPDVLRILQISSRQLQGWERAGIFPAQQAYTFQDLGQLRTLRSLREEEISAASIRHSIVAMKAVAGMTNPLLEAKLVRTGTRLAFRCQGAIVDPIRRQLLFDFEQYDRSSSRPSPLRNPHSVAVPGIQDLFLAAVRAEEAGEKHRAITLYQQMIARDPAYAPAYINLGTIHFHLRQFHRAEELYRRATEIDPDYVLAFFDLGNVLDELERPEESIAAYLQAVALAPQYADAHYNLALAYERKGIVRRALRHWRAYVKLDKSGPWSDHARGQIRKLLERETLSVAWRATNFVPHGRQGAALELVGRSPSSM